MVERRWERRLLCADLVRIEWRESGGETRRMTALLEDISKSGACLQTDCPVPVNVLVRLRHGRTMLEGMVTYCAYHDIGYFAGITFAGRHSWSERLFRPKHLVDPAKLDAASPHHVPEPDPREGSDPSGAATET